ESVMFNITAIYGGRSPQFYRAALPSVTAIFSQNCGKPQFRRQIHLEYIRTADTIMPHEKAGFKGSPMGIDEDNREFTAADELRRHAEERLQAKTAELRPPWTEEETRRLVHEFEVYRIELEMQNAELRQTRDELEAALEKYTELFDFAPLGYFTLDGEGEIRAVNLTGAGLLGV